MNKEKDSAILVYNPEKIDRGGEATVISAVENDGSVEASSHIIRSKKGLIKLLKSVAKKSS